MSTKALGILAMLAACTVWGLSPLFYIQLSHVPPAEVLAHRAIWSVVVFACFLLFRGQLGDLAKLLRSPRRALGLALAMSLISVNWFVFIFSVQIGRTTEASLGYYIFPLVAVLIGRFLFSETLNKGKKSAVLLAFVAVLILTIGSGTPPWISLILATTFGFYGALKKLWETDSVLSVTGEMVLFLPVAAACLVYYGSVQSLHFGQGDLDDLLLILSGPLTALPLVWFAYAARSIEMSLVGVLQYINPTLQFVCAVLVFAEPFSQLQAITFGLIWVAVVIFVAADRDTAAKK